MRILFLFQASSVKRTICLRWTSHIGKNVGLKKDILNVKMDIQKIIHSDLPLSKYPRKKLLIGYGMQKNIIQKNLYLFFIKKFSPRIF